MKDNMPARRLIRGSRRIAEYLGDATLNQHLRARPQDFGLFHVGGLLCAYADEIDSIMAAKRAAGAVTPACIEYVRQEATALLVSQRHVLEALADALEARRTLDTMAIDVVIAAAVRKADKGQEKARREVWNRKLESAAAFRQEVEIVSGI